MSTPPVSPSLASRSHPPAASPALTRNISSGLSSRVTRQSPPLRLSALSLQQFAKLPASGASKMPKAPSLPPSQHPDQMTDITLPPAPASATPPTPLLSLNEHAGRAFFSSPQSPGFPSPSRFLGTPPRGSSQSSADASPKFPSFVSFSSRSSAGPFLTPPRGSSSRPAHAQSPELPSSFASSSSSSSAAALPHHSGPFLTPPRGSSSNSAHASPELPSFAFSSSSSSAAALPYNAGSFQTPPRGSSSRPAHAQSPELPSSFASSSSSSSAAALHHSAPFEASSFYSKMQCEDNDPSPPVMGSRFRNAFSRKRLPAAADSNDSDFKEAPTKRARPNHPMNSFLDKAAAIRDTCQLTRDGKEFEVQSFGQGTYGAVYTVTALNDGDELVPGTPNDQVLIKVFHDYPKTSKRLVTKRPLTAAEAGLFVENTRTQYHQMRLVGVPGVHIFNVDTLNADGYFIVERMVRFFDPTIQGDVSQLKTIFDLCFAYGIAADVHHVTQSGGSSNIMVDSQDKVYLIDYRELLEDEEFSLIINDQLRTFGNKANELDPRIVKENLQVDLTSVRNLFTFINSEMNKRVEVLSANPAANLETVQQAFQASISAKREELGLGQEIPLWTLRALLHQSYMAS